MKVFPSVDLMGGAVVSLIGGRPGSQQVEIPGPEQVFDRWIEAGADRIHVVDLDAALGRGSNEAAIRAEVARRRARLQVGGGIRSEAQVAAWLRAGADRVVVGTKGVTNPAWLEQVARAHPGRIVQAVDAYEDRVVVRGWAQRTDRDLVEFAQSLDRLPLAGLLYTAVHVEGRLQGLDRPRVRALVEAVDLPVFASGGIASLDDVRFLREAGAAEAILGVALYLGRIDFSESRRVAEGD